MRRKDREITDLREIERIIRRCMSIRIAMLDGEYPYIVPMNFGYAFEGEKLRISMHSAKAGKKIDLLRANPRVAFELCVEKGLEDGKSPCNYGYLYECVMGRGTIRFVEDPAEKVALLALLARHQTGRDFAFTELHAGTVEVLVLEVEELSAKAQKPKPIRV
ncbi:MAG TPA: pyridoxamine 5'-phosphate oxidase family protein [Clostridia bacterium]|nr:pyridoxamine 5'-phosphate oxidase family protein [Clostridia bacterium]